MRPVRYLSPEWFDAVRTALAAVTDPPGKNEATASFGFVVTDPPSSHPRAGSAIAYALIADPERGRWTLVEGSADADVRFTTTYAVAYGVATGRQAAGRAFLDGSIRIGGHIGILLDRAGDLELISGHFPDIVPEADDA